jgi:hypothetical protein
MAESNAPRSLRGKWASPTTNPLATVCTVHHSPPPSLLPPTEQVQYSPRKANQPKWHSRPAANYSTRGIRGGWGCNAAIDLYALALGLDPSTGELPPAFNDLPREVVWPSLDAFFAWLPRPSEKGMSAISSTQLPITSNRGRGGIRSDTQLRHLAAAGRPAAASAS